MGWASPYIEKLKKGEVVTFRPKGNSMSPKIESGNLVTVSPDVSTLNKGDIVLCRCRGSYFCHLITATKDDRYQIGNNHGHVNGWVSKDSIFGRVTKVEV